jgi:hypothetical protein
MSKSNAPPIRWLVRPDPLNYPAALSYLSLTHEAHEANALVKRLRRASMTAFKAKDIFRASGLSLLGISNAHIRRDQKKIKAGTPLAPLLLVRDHALKKVEIADGYHRLCAVYSYDEDALIPCKIV